MKFFLPFCSLLCLAVFSSCSKDKGDNQMMGGPAIEVRFVSNASMPMGASTRASVVSEGYEANISSLVLLAYDPTKGENADPVIKYPFSDAECSKKMAVVPLGTVAPSTELDFYVVANSSSQYPTLASTNNAEPTLSALKGFVEADPRTKYNNGTLSNLKAGVNQPYGFAMSAYKRVTTNESGSNKPTVVDMVLDRTVARVDVGVTIDKTAFRDNYNDATLEIKYAAIGRYAEQGTIVAPLAVETMAESIANMHKSVTSPASAIDSIRQDNGSVGSHTDAGEYRFYLYSAGGRSGSAITFGGDSGQTRYDPATHMYALLTVVGQFDYDGNPATMKDRKTIFYHIPITGNDLKGGFSRNVYYNVIVKIQGITEQQIRAEISVADWKSVVTQNVNIGG